MSTNDKPTPVTDAPAEARQAPTLPPDMLIILPVRNMVLFPGVVMPVAIKREKTVAGGPGGGARPKRKVGFLLQKKPDTEEPGFDDLHRVGTVASIVRYLTAPDGTHHLVVPGRASLPRARPGGRISRSSSRASSSCPTPAPPTPMSRRARCT